MSGRRGRGRGRGQTLANLEALGVKPGETAPPILQPPPLFPPLNKKPLPLEKDDQWQWDELVAIKQSLRDAMTGSFAYLKAPAKEKDIARYSDKYRTNSNAMNSHRTLLERIPNWRNRLPKELHLRIKKTKIAGGRKETGKGAPVEKLIDLDLLDKQEKEEGKGTSDNEEEEEQMEEGAEYDEDMDEEEGDYQLTYFDPGDDFGGDEDDNLGDY